MGHKFRREFTAAEKTELCDRCKLRTVAETRSELSAYLDAFHRGLARYTEGQNYVALVQCGICVW